MIDKTSSVAHSSLLGLAPDIYGKLVASLSSILLNKNIASRFQVNSTIADILDALGIEDWNEKINYELYYSQCNPANCFYTVTKKFNIPTVVTTVIGLVGGLSVILRILIPPVMKFLRRHRRVQLINVRMSWQGQFRDLLHRKIDSMHSVLHL